MDLLLACYLANANCAIMNVMTALIFVILIVSQLHAFFLVVVVRSSLHALMAVAAIPCFQQSFHVQCPIQFEQICLFGCLQDLLCQVFSILVVLNKLVLTPTSVFSVSLLSVNSSISLHVVPS